MKISIFLVVFLMLFSVAYGSKSGHENEHSSIAFKYVHDQVSYYIEQEAFKLSEMDVAVKWLNWRIESKSLILPKKQERKITITMASIEGAEYKFYLKQYENLIYENTYEAQQYVDFHGELIDYQTPQYVENYTVITSNKIKGIMTSPFEGSNSWNWKNNSDNRRNLHHNRLKQ